MLDHEYIVIYDNGRTPFHQENAVIVSIPAVREEKTIASVVHKLREQLGDRAFIVVCVRDKDDPTVEAAINSGVDAVVLQRLRGYGLAHLSAMHYGKLRVSNAKAIVMVDADDTYDLSKLRNMVEISLNQRALVIGNRLSHRPSKEAMPTSNYIGNKILSSVVFRILFRKNIPDTQSGLKVFPTELLQHLHARGMEFSTEVIVAAIKLGIPIINVPINYYPRTGSPSKLRKFRDFIRILFYMLRKSITIFVFNGILSLLVAQAMLAILLFIGLDKVLALILSGELSIWFGFTLNDRYYARMENGNSVVKFFVRGIKYNGVYIGSVAMASLIALYIHNILGFHLVQANFIASAVVLPLNYIVNLHLTWKW